MAVLARSRYRKAVFDAYRESKTVDYREMHKMGSYFSSLPWRGQELAETRAHMGDNYYPYGMDELRKALDAALQFSYAQGLSKRRLSVDEMFNKPGLALLTWC